MRGFCRCKKTFQHDIHTYQGNEIYEYYKNGNRYTVDLPSLLNPDVSIGYGFDKLEFDNKFEEFTKQQVRGHRLDNILDSK